MPQSSISSSSGTTGTPSLLSGSINPALMLPPPSSHCATMTTGFGELSLCIIIDFDIVGLGIEFMRAFGIFGDFHIVTSCDFGH